VARSPRIVARARLDRLVADIERHAPLEDVERLVLAVVDVQWRLDPGGLRHLDDRHLSARIRRRGLDLRQPGEPPARLALTVANSHRLGRLTRSLRHRYVLSVGL